MYSLSERSRPLLYLVKEIRTVVFLSGARRPNRALRAPDILDLCLWETLSVEKPHGVLMNYNHKENISYHYLGGSDGNGIRTG